MRSYLRPQKHLSLFPLSFPAPKGKMKTRSPKPIFTQQCIWIETKLIFLCNLITVLLHWNVKTMSKKFLSLFLAELHTEQQSMCKRSALPFSTSLLKLNLTKRTSQEVMKTRNRLSICRELHEIFPTKGLFSTVLAPVLCSKKSL